MISKAIPARERAKDYLYNLEAMTNKEAKSLWRQSIKNAWNNCCAYCGNPPIDDKSLTLDHVKPKAKGGEDRTSNCVPACKNCNHSKGSEDWLTWYHRQIFYNIEKEQIIKEWLEMRYHKYPIPVSGDVYDVGIFINQQAA